MNGGVTRRGKGTETEKAGRRGSLGGGGSERYRSAEGSEGEGGWKRELRSEKGA